MRPRPLVALPLCCPTSCWDNWGHLPSLVCALIFNVTSWNWSLSCQARNSQHPPDLSRSFAKLAVWARKPFFPPLFFGGNKLGWLKVCKVKRAHGFCQSFFRKSLFITFSCMGKYQMRNNIKGPLYFRVRESLQEGGQLASLIPKGQRSPYWKSNF